MLLGIATPGALLAAPAVAQAATDVSVDPVSGTLFISAPDTGQTITVSASAGVFTVADSVPISPGSGCAAANANTVTCPDTGVLEVSADLSPGNDGFISSLVTRVDVDGEGGNDVFIGGPGRDSFRGSDGDDQASGGGGRDSLDGDAGNDLLMGGASDDGLDGGFGNDALLGDAGRDDLAGGPGTDGLNGGNDDDELDGGPGADTMAGGDGIRDELSYRARPTPVRASLAAGAGNGEAGENDTLAAADIENLTGGDSDDDLTGNEEENVIEGGDGNDAVNGAGGDDDLDAGPGNNTVSGGTGDDFLGAEGGADTFNGGPGRDFVSYSSRRRPVTVTNNGRPGDGEAREGDNVKLDVESFSGGSANDRLIGGPGRNSIDGNAGNDVMLGLGSSDLLFGDSGNDVMSGGDGPDYVNGGFDRDILSGGRQRDTLDGDADDDTINSRSGEPDQVACSAGGDRVNADRRDRVDADCEFVRRR